MTDTGKWSLGKTVAVILFLVAIGLIAVYFVRNSSQKAGNVDTTAKIDKLVVKEVKTEKLSAKNAKIKKAKIENAEVKKEKVKRQKVTRQEVKESKVQEQKVVHQEVGQQDVGCQTVERQTVERTECSFPCKPNQPTCQNECSYNNQRRCAPDYLTQNQYQVCGNYDSDACLEWSKVFTCSSDRICRSGWCVPKCISHTVKKCFNNDVYWYNSCGVREEKYQECGADSWTNNYQCSGSWVQREKRKKGCTGSDCYNHPQWENYQNCADMAKVCRNGQCVNNCLDECYYAGQRKCVVGFEEEYQVCGNYDSDSCLEWSSPNSCSGGQMCQNGECVPKCISHYDKVCFNNDVYWYNSCGVREEKYQECGANSSEGWSANYCFGNNVYRKRIRYDKGCLNSQCYSNSYEDKQLVKQCGVNETCRNGQCVCMSCEPGGPGPDPP